MPKLKIYLIKKSKHVQLFFLRFIICTQLVFTNYQLFCQEHFTFHPESLLYLGKSFNRSNMALDPRQALSYEIETLEQGELESAFDINIAVDETQLKKTLNYDLSINAHI